MDLTKIRLQEYIEFLVMTVINAILETQTSLNLKNIDHQENCRNQNQHSAGLIIQL